MQTIFKIQLAIFFFAALMAIAAALWLIGAQRELPAELEAAPEDSSMKISSPAFKDGKFIPPKYACDGENINPPLEIKNLPVGTESLVLIVDNPDAPDGTSVHWIIWNISPEFDFIKEGGAPEGAVIGPNDFRENSYAGPCPPPETVHRYFFKLYALNSVLGQGSFAGKADLEKAMEGKVIKRVQLMGLYARQ